MKANSEKTKQSNKATRRVLAGVLCGASVLSLVLSLVMPPISQAIANDDQTVSAEETVMGGGSSSESTDVENTNNGDTEKLNSDDAEGDEAGDDSQPEEQPEEEQQNEGTTTSDGETVAAVVENEQTRAAAEGIDNASELKNKLESVAENQSGSFQLMKDLDCNEEITLKSGSNITLDLNGCKIKYSSNNKSLFNVSNSAEFTITDSKPGVDEIAGSQPLQDQDHNLIADNCGKTAEMSNYVNDVPNELTYYVTESSVNTTDSTRTNETTYKHEVKITGAIVACSSSKVNLINLEGGTFNLQGGVLTQKNNCNVDGLIYAHNGSIVNMSGGYVCGASVGSSGCGAGIHVDGSTLVISGGVIAGNYAPSGGGVYAMNSTVNMVGGIISGNGTNSYQRGYGAGICAVDSMVTITNGHITNNKYQFYQDAENDWGHLGFGCHGGGGIAAFSSTQGQKKGGLVISGGYITGNYSAEAGGGVYAGAWNQALSGFTFSGGIIASNVAQNSEGGGIRISAPTESVFEVPIDSHAYITNNTTNTSNDWGGGGVFVQGSGDNNVQPASLRISNALITNNHANGFGGGFAACPTGKTAITDTNGIAIFGNSDGKPDGNGYNRSGGTNGKNDDADKLPDGGGGEITEDFKNAGHQDLFLIRDSTNPESLPYIAAVTGQMLGGGAAKWTGTIDGKPKTISKYDGAQAKYMIGLRSDSFVDDQNVAIGLASLYITGNKSNIHGGGIMTNGDVVAGSTKEVKVYPKMKLNGTKMLKGRNLKNNEFEFMLLKQNKIVNENGGTSYTAPSFDSNGILQPNRCSVVNTVKNDGNGQFTFDLGEVYADDDLVYYLVEVPGTDKDVNYDKTIYKIDPTVTEDPTKTHDVLGIKYKYYTVSNVEITKMFDDKTETSDVTPTSEDGVACVALTGGATFTNKYTPYTSTGSWTPKATKVVKGGEMKEFTLQLATNKEFTENVQDKSTQAAGDKSQTLSFAEIEYKLDQLEKLASDSTGRGANKTFTYYVREQQPSALFTNYKYDQSVYKITVTATDQSDKTIKCDATYTKIVNADGKDIPENEQNAVNYVPTKDEATGKEQSVPVFTNTYSTSLPLSGMSGVTLTYLAGAAVLCAAAAWMHIRRKANAKGGKRCE